VHAVSHLDDTHMPTREEIFRASMRPLPRGIKLASLAAAALGLLIFLIGVFVSPDRAWRAFHFNWLFFAAFSSAGVMFVAVQRIVTARWSRPIIRFLEGYVAFLPVAFLFLVLSLTLGYEHIFPQARVTPPAYEKQVYLAPGFHVGRALLVFGIITLLSVWYVWKCVRLDVGLLPDDRAGWARGFRERMRRGFREERREIHSTHSSQGWHAVILALVFGYGWTSLAFDLSMSLDLHFQSTLYGWWFFMGAWVVALMIFSLLVMAWRRYLNVYDLVTEHHIHDLGKLCFAFTAFWGYLTFGQYLIIWYGNMAEETHWARLRLIDPWKGITLAVVFLAFVLPFFGLMSRAAKVFLPTFVLFSLCGILGHYLVRYDEVYPSLYGVAEHVPFGLWEIGALLLYAGTWGACYMAFMDAVPRMRTTLMTSPFRDEVQVPVNPKTMEPLPAHE
ncbi:MAG: hypothetical protein ACJ8AO_16685, partial [Gemmatimonadaceae bacterium]